MDTPDQMNKKLEEMKLKNKHEGLKDLPEEIEIACGAPVKSEGQSYESNEHSDMGNYAFKLFLEEINKNEQLNEFRDLLLRMIIPDENQKSFMLYDPRLEKAIPTQLFKVEITKDLFLTPGDIVALAGDFFGDPNKPIAFGEDEDKAKKDDVNADTKENRFRKAYSTLMNSPQRTGQIKKVIAHIRDDAEAVKPDAHWKIKLKKKIVDATDANNIKYAYELKDESFWHSPYFKLAFTNFDHFGEEARVAYLTGHKLAIEFAKKAGLEKDPIEKRDLVKKALLHELFACHFLTDLFASGHVRTPRKEILNYLVETQTPKDGPVKDIRATPNLINISTVNLMVAGFFARKMHDEDNDKGVYVKHQKADSKPWLSFGDNNYFKPLNNENAKQASDTMLAALKDLVLAYNQQETRLDKNLNEYVPTANGAGNEEANRAPMFKIEKNTILCRGDIFNNIGEKGIVAGTKDAIPYVPLTMGLMGCRFFNVKVIPAGQVATAKAIEAGTTAVTKVVETGQKVVEKTQHAVQQAQELGEQAMQNLYDKMVEMQPTCNFV